MADLENSAELLKKALDELRKSGILTKDTIDALGKSTKNATKGNNELAESSKNAAENLDTFDQKLVRAVKNLTDAGNSIRDNREDFRSLNPAIRATGWVMSKTGKAIAGFADATGEVISGLSWLGGPKTKAIGMAVGGLISSAGKAAGASMDAAAQLAVQFGEFATGELQKVVEAYREVGSVGAIGAEGMKGLYDQSVQAGLAIGQWSKVIARNSQGLALAAGNTYDGSRALASLAKASEVNERQFLALGIGYEQQREFQAQFLQRNRMIGRIQLNDTEALTAASKQYIEQLDELSRVTGLNRDSVAKELEAQLRNVRFNATLAKSAIQDPTGELTKAISSTALVVKEKFGPEIGAGFQDAFGGLATDAARNFEIATGGAGKRIIEQLRNKEITQQEAVYQIQQALAKKYASLGGDQFAERAGKMGTALEAVLPGLQMAAREQNLTVKQQLEALKTGKDAGEAKNKETDEVISAQQALQKMAVELDKIVKDKILPHAATAVRKFTEALTDGITAINEKLGIPSGGGGGGGGRGGSLGGRGPGTSQAPTTGPGGAATPAEAAGTLGAVRALIGKAESNGGDYNVLVGGKKADLTNMTLAQVYDQQKKMMARGSGFESSAVGKYQMLYGTLRDTANKLGLDPNTTKFDQATQDRLADELIVSRGGYNKYASGAISKEKFIRNLSSIWAGIPMDASGRSFYQGTGSNKATVSWNDAMGSFAYGGVSSGPRSGYMSMLHGTEAVIPLPGGRNIPVEMTGMKESLEGQMAMLGEQIGRLDTMISIMQTNTDISRNILRASTA